MNIVTSEPGVHLRMLSLGISAKYSEPFSQTGPSVHLKPVAMRSSFAPFGTIWSIAGSRRSSLTGVDSSAADSRPPSWLGTAATRTKLKTDATTAEIASEERFIRDDLSCETSDRRRSLVKVDSGIHSFVCGLVPQVLDALESPN